METFRKLGISEPILKILKQKGFEKPSEIQEKSIPPTLEGRDVIAGASTGSGKTLAFGARLLQHSKKDYGIQGLILTPTRELAEQISNALYEFAQYDERDVVAIYGGVSMLPQTKGLQRAEIVVATPGRLLDHIERRSIDLRHVNMLVLDEADRMLDMGFIDDVTKIINHLPKERQTMLYSATISNDIARLAKRWLTNPVEISAEPLVDPSKLTQIFYDTPDGLKFSLLKHLLEHEEAKLVMIFCNTRRNVDFVANNLSALGIQSLPIHGGFSQDKRNKVMEAFHGNKTQVMVCTDIAARGLDIKGVTHVYNYDLPIDSKEYIHRIGRTARAGKEGKVINILASRDYDNFNKIKRNDALTITEEPLPFVERVELKWMERGRSSGGRFGGGRGGRGGDRGGSRGNFGGRSRGSSYPRSNRSDMEDYRGEGRRDSGESRENNFRREGSSSYVPRKNNYMGSSSSSYGRGGRSSGGRREGGYSRGRSDDRPRRDSRERRPFGRRF